MGKQKPVIIFAILFISIFLSGCSLVGTLEKTGCKLLPGGDLKDHCWQDAAVRLSMPSVCYFIKGYKFDIVDNSPPMTKCFLRIAEKEKDPFICEKIVEGHPNGYTKTDCYLATAIAARNTAYCDLIVDNISRGFGMITINRDACYAQVGQRPTYCADEKDPTKCLTTTAIDLLDVSICEDAGDAKSQQLCLMNAIEGIQQRMMAGNARWSWDSSQCRKFNDPSLKYSCSILAVAAFQQDQACNNILETQYNELCKLLVQFHKTLPSSYDGDDKKKALSECDKFSIIPFKAMCLISFGHELDLTAGNEPGEAKDPYNIDAVEFYVKGCDMLEDKDTPAELSYLCVMLPSNIVKTGYCAEYEDKRVTDLCYEVDAMNTGDCEKIADPETKSECKDNVLVYYKAMRKRCGSLESSPDEYDACQEKFQEGFFMQALDVRMPETLSNFMKGK